MTPSGASHLESEGADAEAVTVRLAAPQRGAGLPRSARRRWRARGAEHAGHVRVDGAQVEHRVRSPAGEALDDLQHAQHAGAGLRVAQPRLDGRQLQRAAASLRPDQPAWRRAPMTVFDNQSTHYAITTVGLVRLL